MLQLFFACSLFGSLAAESAGGLSLLQARAEVMRSDGVHSNSTEAGFKRFFTDSLMKFAKLHDLSLVMLDDAESASRGSLCLDGSTPGFFYKEGADEGKWLFWLKGGGVCVNATDCVDYLPVKDLEDGSEEYPLFTYGEFANYNHVMLANCDLGYFLGDRDTPTVHHGTKLYSQGARIVKHVVDVLASEYSMTEVLFSGGSGGAYSLFIGAEYFQSIMPSTVTKFAIAPINGWFMGWFSGDGLDVLDQMNTMHGMENTMSSKCKSSVGSEIHSCLNPVTAYEYLDTDSFMVQLYDNTWQYREDLHDTSFSEAWGECLEHPNSKCDNEKSQLLKDTLEEYLDTLKAYSTYSRNGMGGWISTCTVHIFYQHEDEFSTYSVQGATAGAAVEKWWKTAGTNQAAQWYMPCTLGNAPNVQCERTCSV